MSQPPIRTEPIHLDDDAVDAINVERAAKGLDPLPYVSDALALLEQRASLNEFEWPEILGLGHHPDDRVLAALFQWDGLLNAERGSASQGVIYEDVIWRAMEAGDGWSPTLEAMDRHLEARESHWIAPWVRRYRAELYRDATDRLGPWIESETDPRRLEPLLDWEYPTELVLRLIRCADEPFFDRAFHAHPDGIMEMRDNRHVSHLGRHVFDRLIEGAESGRTEHCGTLERLLVSPNMRVEADMVDEVLAKAGALDGLGRSALLRAAQSMALRCESTSPDALDTVLGAVEAGDITTHDSLLTFFVRHPAADGRIWRRVAGMTGNAEVRTALAETEGARRDPEVRKNLLRSSAADVVTSLLGDPQDPEEFAQLVRKYARRKPDLVLDALETADPRVLAGLDPAVFTPLLKAQDGQTRMRATLALGRLAKARRPVAEERPAKVRGPE